MPRFLQTSDLIVTRELGEAVATTLNEHLACYLINHGIVVAGTSIERAVVSAINLERASQAQLLASASGQTFRWTADEEIPGKREKIFRNDRLRAVWQYYCRRIGPL